MWNHLEEVAQLDDPLAPPLSSLRDKPLQLVKDLLGVLLGPHARRILRVRQVDVPDHQKLAHLLISHHNVLTARRTHLQRISQLMQLTLNRIRIT